jgi:SDR family mycofactocin-dependent oxidoreductase
MTIASGMGDTLADEREEYSMGAFDGRVAFITGGARGQGRAHAVAFAREGADVVVCDYFGGLDAVRYPLPDASELQQTVKLVEAEGRRCLAAEADVRDLAALEALVQQATAELGRIDIACANAGIATAEGRPVFATSELTWHQVIDINLTGVFNTIRAVGPGMAERRYGRIIATASMMGRTSGPNTAGYTASKWGVIGLVKSAAQDFAGYGVTVNAVAPGNVDTPMIQNEAIRRLMRPELDNPTSDDAAEVFQRLHVLPTPWVQPEEITRAVLFLAAEDARNISGTVMSIDAGASARTTA